MVLLTQFLSAIARRLCLLMISLSCSIYKKIGVHCLYAMHCAAHNGAALQFIVQSNY